MGELAADLQFHRIMRRKGRLVEVSVGVLVVGCSLKTNAHA